VLKHARDHHDHNASNHSPNGGPATGSRFADDDDNAYGRRLLIAKAGCVWGVAGTALSAIFAFQKAAVNSTGHKPVATVVNDAQDS
jgi:hypothetical protein